MNETKRQSARGSVVSGDVTDAERPSGLGEPDGNSSDAERPTGSVPSRRVTLTDAERPSGSGSLPNEAELAEFRAWKETTKLGGSALSIPASSRARGPGAPRKWTPERLESLCTRLRAGDWLSWACAEEGLSESSLSELMERNPDIANQVETARSEPRRKWLREAMEDTTGKIWPMRAYALERHDPKNFHLVQKKQIETTGNALPSVTIKLSREDRRSVLRGDLREPIEMLPSPKDPEK